MRDFYQIGIAGWIGSNIRGILASGALALTAATPIILSITTNLQAQESVEMRFSVIPLLTAMPIYVGLENGYFTDEGIDLELTKIEGGAPISQAIMAGSLQGGESGAIPFMIATSRGAKLVNVCTFIRTDPRKVLHGIVVHKDAGIGDISDLKNKIIGVHTFGSMEDVRLRAEVLPKLGLTDKDVRIVEIPFSAMEGSLKNRRVDAVMPFQPFLEALDSNPDYKLIYDLNDLLPADGFPFDTYLFSRSFVEEHPETVDGFIRAIQKGIDFIEKDPEGAVELVQDYLKFPEDLSKRAVKQMAFNRDCSHKPESYQAFADEISKVGLLAEGYDPAPHLRAPAN